MSTQAIILFAHGARDPDWALPFVIIKKQVQAARPNAYVELAFQDFMTPALEAAVGQAAAQGATRVVVVPLFMAQGSHMKQDLPRMLGKLREQHSGLEITALSAIGDAPEILQAVTNWVLGATPD